MFTFLKKTILQKSTFFCLLLCICSCKEGTNKYTETEISENDSQIYNLQSIDLDQLTTRLFQNFHSNPITQEQRDENRIIDYAIKHKINAVKDPSGLYYLILREGQGEFLKHNDPVQCKYQGRLLDETIFDGNFNKKSTLDFKVGQMIHGWNIGLKKMKKGSKALFLIPSRLAYGPKGFPGRIEPNEVLAFEVEIVP